MGKMNGCKAGHEAGRGEAAPSIHANLALAECLRRDDIADERPHDLQRSSTAILA